MAESERLLITGATGFVGRHLVRGLLRDGHSVAALVRRGSKSGTLDTRATVMEIDGTTEDFAQRVADFAPTAAIHAATHFVAQHTPDDIVPMVAANLTFGAQLLDALRRAGVGRLVNFGTSWQQFGGPDYRPVSLYAATKQAFEDLAAFYVDACGLRAVTLKLTDTYGPDDERAKLLPFLLQAARNGTELSMSPGEQRVTFVHVHDVVDAVRIALRRTAGMASGAEAFTIAGDEVISLREFVDRVSRATGRPIAVNWGARPYREREVMVPSLGRRLPGWTPTIGLDQGLRVLVDV